VALSKRLRKLNLPNAYLKRAWHSDLVRCGGLCVLLATWAYQFVRTH